MILTLAFTVVEKADPIDNFSGSLDGQRHTISNLTANRPEEDYVGLISDIQSNGVIENINFIDATISAKDI